jgi:hypothetical protein
MENARVEANSQWMHSFPHIRSSSLPYISAPSDMANNDIIRGGKRRYSENIDQPPTEEGNSVDFYHRQASLDFFSTNDKPIAAESQFARNIRHRPLLSHMERNYCDHALAEVEGAMETI